MGRAEGKLWLQVFGDLEEFLRKGCCTIYSQKVNNSKLSPAIFALVESLARESGCQE